jgi:hypothetical protein
MDKGQPFLKNASNAKPDFVVVYVQQATQKLLLVWSITLWDFGPFVLEIFKLVVVVA